MFAYPAGSKKQTTLSQRQVMRMKTLDDIYFEASVMTIPDKLKLEDFGPKLYTEALKRIGTNIEVIANKKKTLKCGTRAYRTDIKWIFQETIPIMTHLVSFFKGGKCIYVAAHPTMYDPEMVEMVEGVTLIPPR